MIASALINQKAVSQLTRTSSSWHGTVGTISHRHNTQLYVISRDLTADRKSLPRTAGPRAYAPTHKQHKNTRNLLVASVFLMLPRIPTSKRSMVMTLIAAQ